MDVCVGLSPLLPGLARAVGAGPGVVPVVAQPKKVYNPSGSKREISQLPLFFIPLASASSCHPRHPRYPRHQPMFSSRFIGFLRHPLWLPQRVTVVATSCPVSFSSRILSEYEKIFRKAEIEEPSYYFRHARKTSDNCTDYLPLEIVSTSTPPRPLLKFSLQAHPPRVYADFLTYLEENEKLPLRNTSRFGHFPTAVRITAEDWENLDSMIQTAARSYGPKVRT